MPASSRDFRCRLSAGVGARGFDISQLFEAWLMSARAARQAHNAAQQQRRRAASHCQDSIIYADFARRCARYHRSCQLRATEITRMLVSPATFAMPMLYHAAGQLPCSLRLFSLFRFMISLLRSAAQCRLLFDYAMPDAPRRLSRYAMAAGLPGIAVYGRGRCLAILLLDDGRYWRDIFDYRLARRFILILASGGQRAAPAIAYRRMPAATLEINLGAAASLPRWRLPSRLI